MRVVDAHHHLWDPNNDRYVNFRGGGRPRFWGSFQELPGRYLAQEYRADVEPIGVVKSVHVEAGFDQSDPVGETRLLQSIADDPTSKGFPHAIVGGVDLSDPEVEQILEENAQFANFRGVRQMLNRHAVSLLNLAPRDYLNDPQWQRNFGLLHRYGLSFDLSVNPGQLIQAAELARRYPDVPMVLCHAGFPIERYRADIDMWRDGMRALAACPNVFVKVSGLGMFDRYWTVSSLQRIVIETIGFFGVERAMFGSNFPIDTLMSTPHGVIDALTTILHEFSDSEREHFFSGTASRFYRI